MGPGAFLRGNVQQARDTQPEPGGAIAQVRAAASGATHPELRRALANSLPEGDRVAEGQRLAAREPPNQRGGGLDTEAPEPAGSDRKGPAPVPGHDVAPLGGNPPSEPSARQQPARKAQEDRTGLCHPRVFAPGGLALAEVHLRGAVGGAPEHNSTVDSTGERAA